MSKDRNENEYISSAVKAMWICPGVVPAVSENRLEGVYCSLKMRRHLPDLYCVFCTTNNACPLDSENIIVHGDRPSEKIRELGKKFRADNQTT